MLKIQNATYFRYGGTFTQGCINLVLKNNTNIGMTLDFGLEDFGL
jgi:hypothetical protein